MKCQNKGYKGLAIFIMLFAILPVIALPFSIGFSEDIQQDTPAYVPGQVVVLIKETNLGDREVESALQGKTTSQFTVKRLYAGELDPVQKNYQKRLILLTFDEKTDIFATAESIAQNNLVELAEPNYIGTVQLIPNDSYYVNQWAPEKIGLLQSYDITLGSPDITIALVDSGVDQDHPDLVQNLYPGYDFVNEDSNPEDDFGHGTRMAGIIAAQTNNGIGVAGTCPNCMIVPIKAANSEGWLTSYDVYQALQYAMNLHTLQGIPENPHPADIISMSFKFDYSNGYLTSAIQEAHDSGAILVAGAGNDNNADMRYPAAYPEVIAVANTNESDGKHISSSYGSWVDIAAPGRNIWTTNYYNSYGVSTGTSASTAMVSGLVGLMLSRNPALDQAQVLQILQDTAAPVNGFPEIGGGRIDAFHALIQSHDAPVLLHLNDITVSEASTATIIAQGIDATNDQLTFTITNPRFQMVPLQAQGEVQQAKFIWYTDYRSAGTYILEITASDGMFTDSQTITLNILDRPDPKQKFPIMATGVS
ncbi:MAG: S8 family serine peptidase [Nanoarchaeota archaeon]